MMAWWRWLRMLVHKTKVPSLKSVLTRFEPLTFRAVRKGSLQSWLFASTPKPADLPDPLKQTLGEPLSNRVLDEVNTAQDELLNRLDRMDHLSPALERSGAALMSEITSSRSNDAVVARLLVVPTPLLPAQSTTPEWSAPGPPKA